MLVQSGWPPRALVFSIAYGVAIAIGVGLWFVERYEVFRPWRVVIRYALLGVVLAALAAVLIWDGMAKHARQAE
jgi:RsiW-degrading membrane proteinase PrsW (M82 family)